MQYRLSTLMGVTLLAGFCAWLSSPPVCVAKNLRNLNATIANGDAWNSPLFSPGSVEPEIFELLFLTEIEDPEHVNVVWFNESTTLKEHHLRMLSRLPHLKAIFVPCKIDDDWLKHLVDCPELRIVSLKNSNATNHAVDYLMRNKTISLIYTEDTQITDSARKKFEGSGAERFADIYFTR